MKKKIFVILGVILFSTSSFVFGYVFGGTKFGFSGYPEFSGYQPSRGYSYNSTVSEYEYNKYRNEVISFIDEVNTYIENCSYDVDRIIDAQDSAKDEAEQAISSFNSWSNNVTVTAGY
jgi:hypothetical protein